MEISTLSPRWRDCVTVAHWGRREFETRMNLWAVDGISLLKSHSGEKLIWISVVRLLRVCGTQSSITRASVEADSKVCVWDQSTCRLSVPHRRLWYWFRRKNLENCVFTEIRPRPLAGSCAASWIIQSGRVSDTVYVRLTELVLEVVSASEIRLPFHLSSCRVRRQSRCESQRLGKLELVWSPEQGSTGGAHTHLQSVDSAFFFFFVCFHYLCMVI